MSANSYSLFVRKQKPSISQYLYGNRVFAMQERRRSSNGASYHKRVGREVKAHRQYGCITSALRVRQQGGEGLCNHIE